MANTTQFTRLVGGIATGIAAAGDSQATATDLTAGINVVATATATSADGVQLPGDREAGDILIIVNNTDAALGVWPPSGGAINGGSANAEKALAANMSGLYISHGDGNWAAVLSA